MSNRAMKCKLCGREGHSLFHKVPNNSQYPEVRAHWLEILDLDETTVTSVTRVCSNHFVASDYYPDSHKLLPVSIPSNLPVSYFCHFCYVFIHRTGVLFEMNV